MLTNYIFIDPIQQVEEIVPKGNATVINLIVNVKGTIQGTDGIPKHSMINSENAAIVSFGMNRVTKQEERNFISSMSLQAYNFILQNPAWISDKIYVAAFENIDAVVTTGLIDISVREALLAFPEKLQCLIMEVNEYVANRYNYAKRNQPTYLNNLLNKVPFFSKLPDKKRIESLEMYYINQLEILMDIENLAKVNRVYPDIAMDILYSDNNTMMITLGKSYQEKVDVVAQQVYSANPSLKRVIVLRQHYSSQLSSVTVLNRCAYDDNFKVIPYIPVRELNELEKEAKGAPEWRNNKTYIIGPKKGTILNAEQLWNILRII